MSPEPEVRHDKVDFVTEYKADGSVFRKRLTRLTDGRVMCCICFEYTPRDQLNKVWGDLDGAVEDVCRPCAVDEAHYLAWRQSFAHRKTLKVLVTGSRDWPDVSVIQNALDLLLAAAVLTRRRVVVMEGECPSGADKMSKVWSIQQGAMAQGPKKVSLEGVPADWDTCAPDCRPGHRKPKKGGVDLHPGRRADYCPTAGHRRNQDMVDSGADVCLAFVKDGSEGATHCMTAAKAAGIVTVIWRIDSGELVLPPFGWARLVPV